LKYTIYQSDDAGNPLGSYHIFADCVDGTSIEVPCTGCYRVSAITLDGESELSDPICASHTPPVIILGPTEHLSCLEAISGFVQPGGEEATAYFEWGTTTAYGNTTTPVALGSGFFDVPIGEILSGLTLGTTYHYRLVASNILGTTFSPDATFVAADPAFPTVTGVLLARWESDAITAADLVAGVPFDKVKNWPDQSGFGRDATQGLDTLRPFFVESYFGCKPAVHFDETIVKELDFSEDSITQFTAFAVWNFTHCYSTWSFGPMIWKTIPGGNNGFGMIGLTADTNNPIKRLTLYDAASNPTLEFAGPSEGLNLTVTPRGNAVDTWRFDGATCTMRKNGVDQTVTPGSFFNPGGFTLANIGQSRNFIGGYVGAILVFAGALSDEDVLKVENYLNIKYPSY
jgi:hypothetical protein